MVLWIGLAKEVMTGDDWCKILHVFYKLGVCCDVLRSRNSKPPLAIEAVTFSMSPTYDM